MPCINACMYLYVIIYLLPCLELHVFVCCRRLSNKHPKHAEGMTHMCVCEAAGSLSDDGDNANPRCVQVIVHVLISCFLAVAATSSFASKQRKLAGAPRGKTPTPTRRLSRLRRPPNTFEDLIKRYPSACMLLRPSRSKRQQKPKCHCSESRL